MSTSAIPALGSIRLSEFAEQRRAREGSIAGTSWSHGCSPWGRRGGGRVVGYAPHYKKDDEFCFGGVVYYTAWSSSRDCSRDMYLVAFDVKTESFRMITVPARVREFKHKGLLIEFEGRLAVDCYNRPFSGRVLYVDPGGLDRDLEEESFRLARKAVRRRLLGTVEFFPAGMPLTNASVHGSFIHLRPRGGQWRWIAPNGGTQKIRKRSDRRKSSGTRDDSDDSTIVPEELLIEILKRLLVTSLCHFQLRLHSFAVPNLRP
ncbi:hypothetical protein NL676_032161 [Syzygium grande]|nr:hypothetical protein NL676_032161 [Syzygium grande]